MLSLLYQAHNAISSETMWPDLSHLTFEAITKRLIGRPTSFQLYSSNNSSESWQQVCIHKWFPTHKSRLVAETVRHFFRRIYFSFVSFLFSIHILLKKHCVSILTTAWIFFLFAANPTCERLMKSLKKLDYLLSQPMLEYGAINLSILVRSIDRACMTHTQLSLLAIASTFTKHSNFVSGWNLSW